MNLFVWNVGYFNSWKKIHAVLTNAELPGIGCTRNQRDLVRHGGFWKG